MHSALGVQRGCEDEADYVPPRAASPAPLVRLPVHPGQRGHHLPGLAQLPPCHRAVAVRLMKPKRAALYLRVSTDGQTTDNQRQALEAAAERRGWPVVEVYNDNGFSGAKDRDQRPGFNAMLKNGTRRRFDVLMVWSIDRLGRSTHAVVNALADLEAAGVAIYADKEAVDATTPHGRAMLQMAAVL